jgi:nardilysin
VLNELLEVLMCEPCFDTLRTHDQLGYDVSCSYRNTTGCVGFRYTACHPNQLPER